MRNRRGDLSRAAIGRKTYHMLREGDRLAAMDKLTRRDFIETIPAMAALPWLSVPMEP